MSELKLKVRGMHCASCEHIIERKLKKQVGVEKVSVNRMKEVATLNVNDDFDLDDANSVLGRVGYELIEMNNDDSKSNSNYSEDSPMTKVWWTVFICTAFVGLIWMFTNGVNFKFFDIGRMTDNVGPISALFLGFVASISSCLAVTGGLLLALTTNISDSKKWNFSVSFAIGRLLSYGILGGVLGAIGGKLAFSTSVSATLTIIVSIIMILLGLQLIGIFKMPSFIPKKFVHGIENLTANPKQTSIEAGLFGVLTFFLPCGFTQALQLYALQSGSFTLGASVLFMFALGTLPVLVFLGSITMYITPALRKSAMIVAGIVVIILALISVPSALTLYSLGSSGDAVGVQTGSQNLQVVATAPLAEIVDGVQQITTTVKGYDYEPTELTVKAGIPVKWTIYGQGASGCAKSFVAPAFKVNKVLSSLEPTIAEFTPTKKGTYQFSCSMGMAGPGTITVV